MPADKKKTEKDIRQIIADAKKTARVIQKMRKAGASNHEISKALEISEEDLQLL